MISKKGEVIEKQNLSPLISIYMPTYNRRQLLARAISSVLKQTYENFELIIIDDGSNDGTHSLLEKYAASDRRIRWLVKPNHIPRGACASRNIAINKATGRFITGIDDDDYFCPHRLMDFVKHWRDGILGLYSDVVIEKNDKKRTIRNPKLVYARTLLAKNYFSQLFLELETLKKYNGFDERFPIWQDFELWYRLLRNSNGYVANTGTATYVLCLDDSHYRISHKRFFSVKKAYTFFCREHKLSKRERRVLLVQVFKYSPSLMPWQYCFSVLCTGTSPVLLGQISKISLKKIFHLP